MVKHTTRLNSSLQRLSILINIICVLVICLSSPAAAQRKKKRKDEVDSNQIKISKLLNLTAGTRLAILDCKGAEEVVCEAAHTYLKWIGYDGAVLNATSKKLEYHTVCEIVRFKPIVIMQSKYEGEATLSFRFCNGTEIVIRKKIKLGSAYNRPLFIMSQTLSEQFWKICPIYIPAFNKSFLLKLSTRESGWKEDSLMAYLKTIPKASIEGIYEEVVGELNKKEPNLKFAVVKKGNGYDLIYLQGYSNFKDWAPLEHKGRLELTGSDLTYKVIWIDKYKDENRNILGNWENGVLKLSLANTVTTVTGETSTNITVAGIFLKLLINDDSK